MLIRLILVNPRCIQVCIRAMEEDAISCHEIPADKQPSIGGLVKPTRLDNLS
ncbi:unnamed protein product [Arabidopsis halleri]